MVFRLELVDLEPSDDEKLEIIEARGEDYKDVPAKWHSQPATVLSGGCQLKLSSTTVG